MKKDSIGNDIYPIEQSLTYITQMLSDFHIGNSYLRVDNNETDLGGVETELEKLNEKIDKLADSVDNIAGELQSLSNIAETLDNFLGWYIEFNQSKKTK